MKQILPYIETSNNKLTVTSSGVTNITIASGETFLLKDVQYNTSDIDSRILSHSFISVTKYLRFSLSTAEFTLSDTSTPSTSTDMLVAKIDFDGSGNATITTFANKGVVDNISDNVANLMPTYIQGVDFDVKDFIFNYTSNTQAQGVFSRLILLNKTDFTPFYIAGQTITWNITTDLETGTSAKDSTWYDAWLDSSLTRRLAPRITGTTDSTVSGFLADSTATLLTDLIHEGDIVQNLTTREETTASADAAAEGQVAVIDDIFTSGDDYQIIKQSPEGLGEIRDRLGMVYRNSSGNFDDSGYTRPELQKREEYSEEQGDFTVTGTDIVTDIYAYIEPYQVFGFGKTPLWKGVFIMSAYVAPPNTITISGIEFPTSYDQSVATYTEGGFNDDINITAAKNTSGQLSGAYEIRDTDYTYLAVFKFKKKPTFATRS